MGCWFGQAGHDNREGHAGVFVSDQAGKILDMHLHALSQRTPACPVGMLDCERIELPDHAIQLAQRPSQYRSAVRCVPGIADEIACEACSLCRCEKLYGSKSDEWQADQVEFRAALGYPLIDLADEPASAADVHWPSIIVREQVIEQGVQVFHGLSSWLRPCVHRRVHGSG